MSSILEGYLESIIFDKEEFPRLKTMIAQLAEGEMTVRQFKAEIIRSRMKIMEALMEYIPFIKRTNEKQNNFRRPEKDYSKEMAEKEKLLQEVYQRLQKIHLTIENTNKP